MSPLLFEGAPCTSCGHEGPVESAPHQLQPGTMLQGRYLVGRVLGQGGFGITYLGLDTVLDMRVAIKEYFPSGYASRDTSASTTVTMTLGNAPETIRDRKEKFLSEAKTVARLDNVPGVVDIKSYFEENGTAYMVMEYLDGPDLSEAAGDRAFSADETFELLAPIAGALSAIHARDLVHRDVSPQNIKILDDGKGKLTAKLIDFGAARVIDYDDPKTVSVMLKHGYAPEEQYSEHGALGPWTDIYGLAATAYRCIVGAAPPDAFDRIRSKADPVKWPSELGIKIRP